MAISVVGIYGSGVVTGRLFVEVEEGGVAFWRSNWNYVSRRQHTLLLIGKDQIHCNGGSDIRGKIHHPPN